MRIVHTGVPALAGRTMLERSEAFAADHDALRRFVLDEPRGHSAMCAAFLTPPCDPAAHRGVVFVEPLGVVHMCGHGTIAIATMLVETGAVAMTTPETHVVLDTAAGPVTARVHVAGDRVTGVTIRNVPAYSVALDAEVTVSGLGTVRFDLAYGGHFYAMVEAAPLGLALEPAAASRLIEMGERIRVAIEAATDLTHPQGRQSRGLLYVQFWDRRAIRAPICAMRWSWRRRLSIAHRAARARQRAWRISRRVVGSRRGRRSCTSRSSERCSRRGLRGRHGSGRTTRSFPRFAAARGGRESTSSSCGPMIRFLQAFAWRNYFRVGSDGARSFTFGVPSRSLSVRGLAAGTPSRSARAE